MLFLARFNSFSSGILSFANGKGTKSLKLLKIFDFEGAWNELFAKNYFHTQSWSKSIGIFNKSGKNYEIFQNDFTRFLPFFKICEQNSSFFMETGN